ncbi:MAG: tRNA (adenosine(37)-N6)-threonylcarbamoyltransferase complex dimerization subunit type 1 TsaB [Desulfobacterales bacterium]|jgi:tRNA threonylcarbamoyladenosine biosynthesis protein TsaB|nr:tRNA (adenosine(37)-N6)-threonylcarbamoyltransferase complex dimerization subunit type 1 TsaB [Desulfobacteraceae bacterium]MBT7084905.1 tRNA (adenosine(37)-N6)-threonylcarbamoyltransferase complex dimerization subunit type 1 TsaB [Desulfobacterales bacterium]MBT7697893.1 tRNA (adenosine(37)-N6)-threonylcarbamoyltransferase complex dimerization subunit type 1 TsaB [Desulfobacterales bacterium]
MILLAVDTATKSCSVAVAADETLIAEINKVTGDTHSKHLMDMISSVINISGLTFEDIDGFVVTKGPGSFTGLRIGISTIKGLALASGKPIVGVSTLQALAFQFGFSTDHICPMLDARKGEVYFSLLKFEGNMLKTEISENVMHPEKALNHIKGSCIFVGDGALIYNEIISEIMGERAHFALPSHNLIRAASVARLGLDRFKNNDIDDLNTFVPYYIRKSDAEIKKHGN